LSDQKLMGTQLNLPHRTKKKQIE